MSLRSCEWVCVVVGKPHPSHPFTEPHPTVYEIAWADRKRTANGWKNQCLQNERVDCSSHRMRAFVWDFEGSLSSLSFVRF